MRTRHDNINSTTPWLSWTDLGRIALTCIAYGLALTVSCLLYEPVGILAAVWPPGGIALAALLQSPRRLWRPLLAAIFLTGTLANAWIGRPVLASGGYMVANVLETAISAWLIMRCGGDRIRFRRVAEVMALALAATMVNGVTALLGASVAWSTSNASFWMCYRTWWMSDCLGLLIVTPFVLLVCSKWRPAVWHWSRLLEALLLGFLAILVTVVGFGRWPFNPGSLPTPYLLFVPLVWVAVRFGPRSTASYLAVVGVTIVGLTRLNESASPLGGGDPGEHLVMAQAFLGVLAMTGLVLAANGAERRLAFEMSREQGMRLRALGDNLPHGMVFQIVRDHDGTKSFIHVSAGIERLNGLAADAVLQNPALFYHQVIDDDRARLRAEEESSFRNMAVCNVVVRLRRADGQMRWMNLCSAPRRLSDGRVLWDGMELDITERIEAEESLRESESRFRALDGALPLGIFLTDPQGLFLYTNQQYQSLSGLGAEGSRGLCWTSTIHPADQERVRREWREATRAGGSYQSQQRSTRKDGSTLWQTVKAAPIKDKNGTTTGYVGILEDITERKRAEEEVRQLLAETEKARACLLSILEDQKQSEEALRASEERFRTLIENGSDMITVLNREGIIRFQSPSSERILGFPLSEVVGQNVMTFVHADDLSLAVQALGRAEATPGKPVIQRLRLKHRNGGWRYVETIGRAVADGAPDGYIVVNTRDITEQQVAEERRQALEAQLRQAQKLEALGTLAGGIAHDFNNILGAIICFTEVARMDNPDNAELQDHLGHILDGCNRAANLVRQILSFSRRQAPERQPLHLALVVEEALKLLRSSLPSTIEIDVRLQEHLPQVLADSNQIHQVLMNLCTNSAHAMRGKQGLLKVELDLVRAAEGVALPHPELRRQDYVRLAISDNGHGIEEPVMTRLFEPFFTTKAPGEGTGLGLAVVHGIVQEHGGVITVSSQPNVGSTFSIYLPILASAAPHPLTESVDVPMGSSERILVVDDEPALCEVNRRLLTRLGYEPVAFHNPEHAWSALQKEPEGYAAVITDLTMPGMTGLELADRIRAVRPQTPIILTSGYMSSVPEESLRGSGIAALLHKPLDYKTLASAIHNALEEQVGERT